MNHTDDRSTARALIACLDLTDLSDGCTEADIAALCERASTPQGNVAAICIWPRFVTFARRRLDGHIAIATVVNFPAGGEDVEATVAETRLAIADGAHEIDMVIAHRRLPDDPGFVAEQVRRVREAAAGARLKAILETGAIGSPEIIRMACRAALDGGADFLKTSTGKAAESATPASARLLLGAIADSGRRVGFKPAGGVRTFEDAERYWRIAQAICGKDWASPELFRIGASGVLSDLLAVAAGERRPTAKAAY